jgi:hypothetical protein
MEKEKRLGGEDNLPLTRWQLLGDTLHYRFWDLLLVSLLTFVFYIPSLSWLIFCSLDGFLDYTNLNSILLVYGINIPLLAIAGFGMAGLFYFSKKLVWGEGASLPSDFFEGIKKNWAMFLGVYFLIAFLYAFLRVDIASIKISGEFSGLWVGSLEGISYTLFFLFVWALFFTLTESVIYVGDFFHLFWNGFRFVFGAFLTNVPLFLTFFTPFLVFEFVPFYQVSFAMIGLEAIFYFGFSAFFFTEYSYYLFDKSINKKDYPEIIRKGLGKKEEQHGTESV